MAEQPIDNQSTTKIVEVEGENVYRTTTIDDETIADLESQIAAIDADIALATARYITPLQSRRDASQARLDALGS